MPPAGALRDTLGASSSLSPFPCPAPLFYFAAPQSIPLSPFFFLLSFFFCTLFFFSLPCTFESLSASLHISSSSLFLPLLSSCTLFLSLYCPHDFLFCPPPFIQAYLAWLLWCHSSVSDSLCLSYCLAFLHLRCPLRVCLLCGETRKSSEAASVRLCLQSTLSCIFLRSYETSKLIHVPEGNIFSRCLPHTSTASVTVTY